MSVYRSTSPSSLYSDIVKIPSKNKVDRSSGLNPGRADEIQSKTVRGYDRSNAHVQNKVSINDEQVGFNKLSHIGDVIKQNNNNVNTSEQDCVDITHVNHFAVLCVDSSEDEGDSLDLDTVNDPDASCTVRGFQGGESVGKHSKLGKKLSDFVNNYLSMCRNVSLSPKFHKWSRMLANLVNNVTGIPIWPQ